MLAIHRCDKTLLVDAAYKGCVAPQIRAAEKGVVLRL